jgi:hypothetical protein
MADLPVTERIAKLLAEGKRDEAIAAHNATVRQAFERAQQGAIINLTDLMASRDELHVDAFQRRRRRK